MPDDPRYHEDEDEFDDDDDDDSDEFELSLDADASDLEPDQSADPDSDVTLAKSYGLPFIDLTEVTIPPAVIELVPEPIARENFVIPLSLKKGILKIILSDPSDLDTVQKLQFILNLEIQPVFAPREQIIEAINRHYGEEDDDDDAMLVEFTDVDKSAAASVPAAQDDSSPAIVKLVDLIIQEAISLRASDIHIEPFADRIRIRYRIDGILVERDSPPRLLLEPLLSWIKFLSNIARSERPQPQDGRGKMIVQDTRFDLGVSILPTHHGESAVIRIPN